MSFAKLPPHLKRSINVAYFENGTYDQIVAHLEGELELIGLETGGELPKLTTTTKFLFTTMTVNKHTQLQSAEQQQIICRKFKKPGHVNKEYRQRTLKGQERQGEKQTPETPNKKHTHPVRTAKELAAQLTCAEKDQTRLIDPKDPNLKILMNQQTIVENQECLHKISYSLSSKFL